MSEPNPVFEDYQVTLAYDHILREHDPSEGGRCHEECLLCDALLPNETSEDLIEAVAKREG